MEVVNTKIKYPCKAKVTYIGKESKHYDSGVDYLVEIYKSKNRPSIFVCIVDNKLTERGYLTEKLLRSEFRINSIVEDDQPAFILTLSKDGTISYKNEPGTNVGTIISTLEIVKISYALSQLDTK